MRKVVASLCTKASDCQFVVAGFGAPVAPADCAVDGPYPGYKVGYDPDRYGTQGFVDWGRLQVLIGLEGDSDDVNDVKVTIVGPDGVDTGTLGEPFLDEATAGVYSVATTMEGYQMQQALVWIRPGEIASVILPLVTLPSAE